MEPTGAVALIKKSAHVPTFGFDITCVIFSYSPLALSSWSLDFFCCHRFCVVSSAKAFLLVRQKCSTIPTLKLDDDSEDLLDPAGGMLGELFTQR